MKTSFTHRFKDKSYKCPLCGKLSKFRSYNPQGDVYLHEPSACLVPVSEKEKFFDEVDAVVRAVTGIAFSFNSHSMLPFRCAWDKGITSPVLLIRAYFLKRLDELDESMKSIKNKQAAIKEFLNN